jgi:hypothetical protein
MKKLLTSLGSVALFAFLVLAAPPVHAQTSDTPPASPLAVQINADWSLHLNVSVPAIGYSFDQKKLVGQLALGVNYVFDYRGKVALGAGGGYAQTNDTPGLTFTGLLGGPLIGSGTGATFRPAILFEYKWAGGDHERILAATLSLQL